MNKYKIRMVQHSDFVIEANTGEEAKKIAEEALVSVIPPPHRPGKHIISRITRLTKSPRVEKINEG